jgi:PST family polysaccharide transporter
LTVFADDVIALVLGSQWGGAVPLFRFLAPAAICGALLNPFGWLFVSTGRADRQARFGILWTIVIVAAFAVGLPYGPAGVAIGYSLASCSLALPLCVYAVRHTPITIGDLGKALRFPFAAVAIASLTGYVLRTLMPAGASLPVRAIGGPALTVGLYAIVLLIVFKRWPFYRDLLRQILPNRQPTESAPDA